MKIVDAESNIRNKLPDSLNLKLLESQITPSDYKCVTGDLMYVSFLRYSLPVCFLVSKISVLDNRKFIIFPFLTFLLRVIGQEFLTHR